MGKTGILALSKANKIWRKLLHLKHKFLHMLFTFGHANASPHFQCLCYNKLTWLYLNIQCTDCMSGIFLSNSWQGLICIFPKKSNYGNVMHTLDAVLDARNKHLWALICRINSNVFSVFVNTLPRFQRYAYYIGFPLLNHIN